MGHNRGGRNIKPIMLSCFLNDAASGCLHWPKCANNFYDYDCDYHAASSIQASKHPCIQTSSMGGIKCSQYWHSYSNSHASSLRRPRRWKDACASTREPHPRPWLAGRQLYEHVSPLANFLSRRDRRPRIQITIIVLKLVNIWAPKCSNKGLLFYVLYLLPVLAAPRRFSPLLAIKYI